MDGIWMFESDFQGRQERESLPIRRGRDYLFAPVRRLVAAKRQLLSKRAGFIGPTRWYSSTGLRQHAEFIDSRSQPGEKLRLLGCEFFR